MFSSVGLFIVVYYTGYPHTQSFAMESVGILNGCFLYSFSCNSQPHALGRQISEHGDFECLLLHRLPHAQTRQIESVRKYQF